MLIFFSLIVLPSFFYIPFKAAMEPGEVKQSTTNYWQNYLLGELTILLSKFCFLKLLLGFQGKKGWRTLCAHTFLPILTLTAKDFKALRMAAKSMLCLTYYEDYGRG